MLPSFPKILRARVAPGAAVVSKLSPSSKKDNAAYTLQFFCKKPKNNQIGLCVV